MMAFLAQVKHAGKPPHSKRGGETTVARRSAVGTDCDLSAWLLA